MNNKLVIHLCSVIAAVVSLAMVFSALPGWLMGDSPKDVFRLLLCGVCSFTFSAILIAGTVPRGEGARKAGYREGFAVVAFSWVAATLAGMLPYLFVSGMYWYDALFETVSGFSTTGSSVIDRDLRLFSGGTLANGVESLSYGVLFWRSLTHWLGGMGIVVLTLAVLPILNISGQMLYNAEMTGVKSMDSQIAPRIASSAKILWSVYVLLTACEVALLKFAGMSFFDAICHSFSTISCGGFSTKQNSLAFFHSGTIDWIVSFFMFFSGCNFLLHFRFFTGNPMRYFKDEEFRFYLKIVAGSIAVITILLTLTPGIADPISCKSYFFAPLQSLRFATFQVISIVTTTGFSTADYCVWPTLACVILFCLMFVGGCGGSTAGGMKCVRALLVGKQSISEIRRCFFPRLIPDIRLNGVRMEMTTIQKTLAFFTLYLCSWFLCALLLPLLCPSMTLETALSASLSSLSNIGPGFGQIGPSFTYSWVSWPAKVLMSLEMLLGRLELYTLLVLFLPSFWKK